MKNLKQALSTLRPIYRDWPEVPDTFWQALIAGQLKDRAGQTLSAIQKKWVPSLYESLAATEKKQGVFYTPPELARYLVRRTLGEYLSGLQRQIQQRPEEVNPMLAQAMALKILDPACGAGVFLVEAYQCLSDFYASALNLPGVSGSQRAALGQAGRHILQQQLYGIDLDSIALQLGAYLLNALCAPRDNDETPLHLNLRQHDALACDEDYLGGPEFSRAYSFPGWGEWDFVLGNPPYMTEVRSASGLLATLRKSPSLEEIYAPKMDVCDAFVGLSAQLLKPAGQLAFVLPEYWLQRTGSRRLRDYLWRQGAVALIWQFKEEQPFKRARGHHSSLLIWRRDARVHAHDANRECDFGSGALHDEPEPATLNYASRYGAFVIAGQKTSRLLAHLNEQPVRLHTQDIQQGIVIPQGRLRTKDAARLDAESGKKPGCGIFVLTPQEADALQLSPEEWACLKPYYESALFQGTTGFAGQAPDWLIYTDQVMLRQWAENPTPYARLRQHLERFSPIITSSHRPYGLHRARQREWFESPSKVLSMRQTLRPSFAAVSHLAYVGEGFNIICDQRTGWGECPDRLSALLNSSVAGFWFYHQKRKGARLQIDKDVLLRFPLPVCELEKRPFAPGWVETLYGLNSAQQEFLAAFCVDP